MKVVELTRNYGQHAAIFSGFSVVRGDIIITLDADLQNPPEEIPNLIRVMEEGDYDVVGTIRKERKDSSQDFPIPHYQYDHAENHEGEYVRLGVHAAGLPDKYCRADGELSRTFDIHSSTGDLLFKKVTEIEVAHREACRRIPLLPAEAHQSSVSWCPHSPISH